MDFDAASSITHDPPPLTSTDDLDDAVSVHSVFSVASSGRSSAPLHPLIGTTTDEDEDDSAA